MVDAHCHLDEYEDFHSVIADARQGGVAYMITSGASVESSKKSIDIAERYPGVWATVGLGYEDSGGDPSQLLGMTQNKKVVAIGECGLDEKTINEELFASHIQLAHQTGLPLIVHCRNMYKVVYSMVKKVGVSGMLHCFTGNVEWMRRFVDLGWYISFGGIITFKKSEDLREVARQTPQERILVETDSPYLAPEPIRGTRNTPANVMIVAETVGRVRGQTIQVVDQFTTENAKRLFRI